MSTVEGKKQEKRRALLDAAYELFLERGTAKTSVEDITSRAKVGKGTFYLYFQDKGAVMQALLGRVSYQLLDNACAAAEQHAAEIARHDAQYVHDALAFKHVQHRLTGGALRLAVVAVALLAGVQDVGPAVVPGVIFPLLDGLELRPGLRLGRHGEDEAEKAGFFFDIFRISLPRGDPELLHQTSSVTY